MLIYNSYDFKTKHLYISILKSILVYKRGFKMDQETQQFVENIDSWIKQIRTEFNEVKSSIGDIDNVSEFIEEHTGNVQHNYELIKEMVQEIRDLKEEVRVLKALKVMDIKEKLTRRN